MLTKDLKGAELDYAVISTLELWKDAHFLFPAMTMDSTFSGVRIIKSDHETYCVLIPSNPMRQDPQFYSPSSLWQHGGPLIEAYKIQLAFNPCSDWCAELQYTYNYGNTALEAAMRVLVLTQHGNEIVIP